MTRVVTIIEYSNRCKCCLNECDLKNIWEERECDGELVVYGDMLKECFGISLEPSEDVEMICEMCVSRLRDAFSFKREILATQDLLNEAPLDSDNLKLAKDDDTWLHMEEYEQVEYLDPEYTIEELPSMSEVSTPEPIKRKWPKKKIKSERNKTYKQYTQRELKEAIDVVKNGEMSCVEASRMYGIPKYTLSFKVNHGDSKDDEAKDINTEKHFKLIEEIKQLLTYTNAIPFKTKTTRYHCFYCSTDGPIFEDAEELRNHTMNEHFTERISSIEQYMKPQWMNEIIRLDVEGLHCTECFTLLPDWNQMFEHFAEVHVLEFDEAYTRVIPYALTYALKCVLCHEGFHNFGHLDSHMNNHYSNYICYECGYTFLAASRLDKHLKVHKTGSYPCKMCNKVFNLEKYRSKHISLVHKQECNIKCLYCAEKFVGTVQRHVHVTEMHKEKVKTYTCEQCGNCYTWKPYFLAHMRRKHGSEKNYTCKYCPKRFLMQYELKNHLMKHISKKFFLCGQCGESFNRVALLKSHLLTHSKK